jgi:2-methylcitrate dehydratase PrpD
VEAEKMDRSSTLGVTSELARFVAGFDKDKLPLEVKHQVARSLVNWVGCAVGGSEHPALIKAMEAFKPFLGSGHASILGRAERVDALHAALFNGISSHVLDFDDTHHATLVHPSGPVFSAILALSEFVPIDGVTFVTAIALGIEVECRIALGVCPAHYDIGWHVTGTVGGFGAATAVGYALELNAQQMAWAYGIAATQAAGLREVFGTMCKSLHPGRAAQSGLSAALMAKQGFTSSERVLEAPRGFAHVMSVDPHLSDSLVGLGTRWVVMDNAFKPYACGLVIHPVIDGCISLHKKLGARTPSIEQVHLRVNPLVLELTGKTEPRTGLEGKFSVYHSAAVVLIDGLSTSKHYTDTVVSRADVVALRPKVRAEIDQSVAVDEAFLSLTFADGSVITLHVEHALGSLQKPMSDADINFKFLDLTSGKFTKEKSQQVLDQCWRVGQMANAGDLGAVLRSE